ncbi:inositol-pentakisphosphate 2-kinase [Aspergillus ruber CBS 135680]|uniref:Inositol-pentakisphosphate 2-kinase n=1 Tax=Aspergillus ruber (strain CBS 135680) TaxID=1388766 RepID=A0A017SUE5_ASPRC|nr:uncharacterized protein EURHEDRAFT_512065 [Aspergillus ruber CBS 135680]EYE99925.1 hypothetical protein EURHEDRAFT_512065 [Aspergillus ruber CBS 135680]
MTNPDHLEFPSGAQLDYLAEGGANVIYRIIWAPATATAGPKQKDAMPSNEQMSIPPMLRGKLLRLRKDTKSSISYQEISRNFDRIIRPLFQSEEVVDQTLVQLPRGLVQQCNERLRAAELNGTRPHRRCGVYLSLNEPFGLLVTDMTTFNDPGMIMAELKPKWLLQSPSAPLDARRCRTCALRDMKNYESRKACGSEDKSFCPLGLVSDRSEHVLRATRFVKGCQDQDRLARFLHRNSTLLKLQAHQEAMRDVGLHGQSAQSKERSLAMTLRDCTMFIKMPLDGEGPVEVRLGDLDLKTGAGGKAQYWLDLENRLISQGWYSGTNCGQASSECVLQSLPLKH